MKFVGNVLKFMRMLIVSLGAKIAFRSNVFISLDQLVVDEEKYDKTYNEKS